MSTPAGSGVGDALSTLWDFALAETRPPCTTQMLQTQESTQVIHFASVSQNLDEEPMDLTVKKNANVPAGEPEMRNEARDKEAEAAEAEVVVETLLNEVEEGSNDLRVWALRGYPYSKLETSALLKSVVDVAGSMMAIAGRKSFDELALDMRRGIFWDGGNPSLINIYDKYRGEKGPNYLRRDGGSLKTKWNRMIETIVVKGRLFFIQNGLLEPDVRNEQDFLIKLATACFEARQPARLALVKPGTAEKIKAEVADSLNWLNSMVVHKPIGDQSN